VLVERELRERERESYSQRDERMDGWMDNIHLGEQSVGGKILLNCIRSCPFARCTNI